MDETTLALQNLLGRFDAGESDAKDELVARAYDRLLVVARRLLGSFLRVRAEEETAGILNEAYLRLHKALDDVRPESVRQFMGLAALEIRRVLLDRIRQIVGRGKEKRPGKISLDAPGAGERGKSHDLEDSGVDTSRAGMALDLLESIEQLADDEREAVEMLFFHGHTQAEAAELVGVHEDTIKRRWSRARIKLADRLSDFQ